MLNTRFEQTLFAGSPVDPARSFFRGHNWIPAFAFLAFLLQVSPALAVEGPVIPNYSTKSDLDLAKDVAPYVYFHDKEHNWPVDIETYLSRANLRRKSDGAYLGRVLDTDNLFRILRAAGIDSKDTYLDVDDSLYPGDSDLSRTRPYVRVINRPQGTNFQTGMKQILYLGPYKEIQFWFFFPFNGCQTHRVTSWRPAAPWDTYTRHFQMCDAARHEGDVEAVSVFINTVTKRPIGVATTRHGAVIFTHWDQLKTSGLRPIIYSAWASHAMYTRTDNVDLSKSDFSAGAALTCGLINISYWKLMDFPWGDGNVWNPTKYKDNLVLQTDTTPITKYLGNWGLMGMDNRAVREPSEWGYDQNNGKDIIPYVSDAYFATCFQNLQSLGRVVWDLTSVVGDNPILAFDPTGVEANKLIGNGTDWFSKPVWLYGMWIEKVGP